MAVPQWGMGSFYLVGVSGGKEVASGPAASRSLSIRTILTYAVQNLVNYLTLLASFERHSRSIAHSFSDSFSSKYGFDRY